MRVLMCCKSGFYGFELRKNAQKRHLGPFLPVFFSRGVGIHFRIVEPIKLSQMLKAMKATDAKGNPVPFSINAVTLDLQRKTGGELILWENVQLARNYKALPVTERKEFVPQHREKLPDHWKSGIIKIYNPATGKIVSVRIRLITDFKLFTDPHWREVRL